MTLNPNQFAMTNEKGSTDLGFLKNVVSCAVSASESGELVAGDAVTIEDSAGGVPKVLLATADNADMFGFVTRNLKDQNRVAGEPLEVAIKNTVMVMEAGAAIARGAKVEFDVSAKKVITSAGTNTIVGWAYDKAAADGDLIRVYIETPAEA